MEIFGFKSFADRARIEFTPGITALLGPNGCGKSNVVDAIKWVLGEQASRSLRAEKMEDVIFNGTDQRKALNVAEVTLTVSNETQVLALDLPEISIKRRLYRSGESEYFINNTVVRLKEVRELFYDTGVGKSAYSVMEQGRIDQILSNKPEERRYLFEEAAGITKYKARGQEAERRLEKTEENLRQLEGILGELRHSWESLKKQSERTLSFRGLKKELFTLEKDQQLHRWKALLDQKAQQTEKSEAAISRKIQAKLELDELNTSLSSGMQDVNRLESQQFELQKTLLELDLERKGLHQQGDLQRERLSVYRQDAHRHAAQAEAIGSRLAELQAAALDKQAEAESVRLELLACRSNMEEYSLALESARIAVADHESAIRAAEQQAAELESLDSQRQDQWRELTDVLVQELDQRLKDDGFAWHQLPGLTTQMEATLESLKVLLRGRSDHLGLLLQTPASGAWEQVVTQVRTSLEEAVAQIVGFEHDWETYKGAVPQFLGEFLAPEGILTQKRDLELLLAGGRAEWKLQKEVIRQRQTDRELASQLIETHRTTLESLRMNEVRMVARATSATESLQRLTQESASQEVQLTSTLAEQAAIEGKITLCLGDLSTLEQRVSQLGDREKTVQTAVETSRHDLESRNKALAGRQIELQRQLEKVNSVQADLEALQMSQVRVDTEVQGLLDHFRDKHSVGLDEFSSELTGLSAQGDWKDLVSQKKEELRLLGQINLLAVEEFAEIDQRHQFLQGQINDLRKAKDDLQKVTTEIRKESTQLFSDAFEQIRINFNTTFRRLFGGGRAELRLTEPETVLESGIEMLCQPPGKKLESINLLSGGEKSMTAVALLFATFMVRPSPFCILDEIDAALDEANVSRFVAMLTEFSHRSQFVVITHNKKTVTGSTTMIGVTMESPGVSTILAVRLASDPVEASA
ncbi:MAG: AAA family ATPase [Spirochaetales bacterium]